MPHSHSLQHRKSRYFWSLFVIALFFILVTLIPLVISSSVKADMSVNQLFDPYIVYPVNGDVASVAVADFNGDSHNDVAVTTGRTANKLYLFAQTQTHILSLTEQSDVPFQTDTMVAGDFNHDTRADLAYASFINNTLGVKLQNGGGTLDPVLNYATGNGPGALVVDDLNLDGWQDIALAHAGSASIGIFEQQATGVFSGMLSYLSTADARNDIDTGDFNGDGRLDIVRLNQQNSTFALEVFLQTAEGGFNRTHSYALSMANSLVAGDVTGDGLADVVVSQGGNRPTSKLIIFAQTITGTLTLQTTYDSYDIPQPVRLADIDMDGRLDAVVLHGGWARLGVYLQQAAGGFANEELYTIPTPSWFKPQSLVIADINGDQLPDAVIAGSDRGLIILPHKVPPAPTPPSLPPVSNPLLYFSFKSNTSAGGAIAGDEDIAAHDTTSNKWSLVFDGSTVKITASNLNAIESENDGSILFSVVTTATVPGIGTVTPADIVRFVPTSLGKGSATAGTFSLYFDGSDVGLEIFTTSGIHEGIDGLARTADGKLLISTAGSFVVAGLTGDDEDLIVFTPASLGDATAGSWQLYLDGSDVDLGEYNEDIQNIWLDPATSNLYVMAEGATINGILDDGNDVWLCHPQGLGADSGCDWVRFWDGDNYVIGTKIIDALDIAIAPPPLPTATPTATATKPPTATPTQTPLPTATPPGGLTIYVNMEGSGNVGSTSFSDEDILAQDSDTGTWSLIFDGSDVGVPAAARIDAFEMEQDGSILLSFFANCVLPNIGTVAPADIVRFIPTQLGTDTAGSFALAFDGSDVELTSSSENIDAIGRDSAGRLVISTVSSLVAGGLIASDEDLVVFNASSLGDTTSGSWQMYLDAGDVGLTLTAEDIQGLWIDSNGQLYLSIEGTFILNNGLSGDGNDIVICTPTSLGTFSSCTFRSFWDGAANGLSTVVLDGIEIGPAIAPSLLAAQSQSAAQALTDVAANTPELAEEVEEVEEQVVEENAVDQPAESMIAVVEPVENEPVIEADATGLLETPDRKDVAAQNQIYLPLVAN